MSSRTWHFIPTILCVEKIWASKQNVQDVQNNFSNMVFYNNISTSTLPHGILPLPNPHQVDPVHARIGIQNWVTLGICGRGMLLDLISHQTSISPSKTLPYEHVVPVSWEYMLTPLIHLLSSSLWSMHPISMHELEECAKAQGVKFR
ncbi:hypothetical protein DFH08DRAFT_1051062 [Mycena albidolilacea]|uniref:Uncharacterized protein n=1 Tax=Mycena albidolilacea TaxID=1033008 RepID=A0AAD6Z5B9_9AGAR|nr:hypothetical protein DFH08DRAFT_1051062 [Mycena albidolilacea]